ESERAIESGARSIDFVNRPQTPAEFHKMIAMRNRSVVLQFVVILAVVLHARTGAATAERPKHVDRCSSRKPGRQLLQRSRHRSLIAAVAQILKARLIDHLRTEDLRIRDLNGVLGGEGVVAGLW